MERARGPALGALLLVVLASSCGAGRDARPAVWSYVSAAITEPNCATSGCHNQTTAASGLDFSTPDRGYASLTGSWLWIANSQSSAEPACATNGAPTLCLKASRSLVIPFDPAQSGLLQILRGTARPAMPPDRSLPAADVALIESWILNGATDDRARSPASPPTSAQADGGHDAAAPGDASGPEISETPDGAQDGGHQ